MKKKVLGLVAVATAAALTIGGGLIACDNNKDDSIYVGNTAATTGAFAAVGVPFNIGLEASLKAYNDDGGFNGRSVKLKHYDDGGDASASATFTEKLIHEDDVFAIVGNFYGPCVEANLPIIKQSGTPMVYAAAGNDSLVNEHATSFGDRCIMPVQPTYITEGRMLLLRAFAPMAVVDTTSATGYATTGALGGQKVGIITVTTDEGSVGMKKGIDAEKASLTDAQKANITEVNISTSDGYNAAIATLKTAGCDTVIAAVTQNSFVAIQNAMKAANYSANVITSYNNANTAQANGELVYELADQTNPLLSKIIYAQSWINIYDSYTITATGIEWNYHYKGILWDAYKALPTSTDKDGNNIYEDGVIAFSEEYWGVAEDIYNYCISAGIDAGDAFNYSYNSYALAGYVAGDLFCQGLEEMEKQEKELTKENFVDIMESKEYHVSMGESISFADGARRGVEDFGMTAFSATKVGETYVVSSATTKGLTSLEYYRNLLKPAQE